MKSPKIMQTTTGAQMTHSVNNRRNISRTFSAVRVLALLLLFCSAAVYESAHLTSLEDPDVWWHLRTGIWILQDHAVPHNGLFSQYSSLPWIASSWGWEALLALGYKAIGLRAVPVISMLFNIALAVSAFLLARSQSKRFWIAVFLAIATQGALAGVRPLPSVCSIVCFSIELGLLFESKRTGNARILFYLPPLFVLWVNLHVQFVYGLILLGLFLAAAVTEDFFRHSGGNCCDSRLSLLPIKNIGVVIAVTVAATLLNPYTYHIYDVVIQNASPAGYIAEEHAMNFRQAQHYAVLLMAMAGFLMLGRRRSRDPFKLALMISTTALAFAIGGDAGFVVMASVAVIADAFRSDATDAQAGKSLGKRETVLTLVLLAIIGLAAACRIPSSQEILLNRIGDSLPARACDSIKQMRLSGPLFNEYKWGSFLTWYLPEYPVAIDSRKDLYGDAITNRYFKDTFGDTPLADPSFAEAKIFLLPADSPMGEALSENPDFKLVYRDKLAMVLVRPN